MHTHASAGALRAQSLNRLFVSTIVAIAMALGISAIAGTQNAYAADQDDLAAASAMLSTQDTDISTIYVDVMKKCPKCGKSHSMPKLANGTYVTSKHEGIRIGAAQFTKGKVPSDAFYFTIGSNVPYLDNVELKYVPAKGNNAAYYLVKPYLTSATDSMFILESNSDRGNMAMIDLVTNEVSTLPEYACQVGTSTGSQQPMYRMYNKWSGEHLFTTDQAELKKNVKLGWKNEGVAWNAPTAGTKVYRLYNKYSGDHHYTTDKSEYDTCKKAGWTGEGTGFYSAGNTPVFRLYNKYVKSFYHHYTMNSAEHKQCVEDGWKDEGVGWYGYAVA